MVVEVALISRNFKFADLSELGVEWDLEGQCFGGNGSVGKVKQWCS